MVEASLGVLRLKESKPRVVNGGHPSKKNDFGAFDSGSWWRSAFDVVSA